METKQRSRVQSSALQTELIATQKPTLKTLQVNRALIFCSFTHHVLVRL